MPQSVLQPSFAKGELSPELRRRIDLAAYQIGFETGKNMCVLPRGGVQTRAGTKFITETKDSTKPSRLVEFIFSTQQAYILEFGDYYIRYFKDGGQIVNEDDTPYEIASPYPAAAIWQLKFEQSADTLYITHTGYQTHKLTRTGHTAWTLTPILFSPSPMLRENSDIYNTITITGKVQIARPSADIVAGGWSSTAASMYEAIDEITAYDSDYITSSLNTVKIKLSTVVTPATRKGHVLKIKMLLSATVALDIALYCGSTKIYGMQIADPNNKARTYEMFIPEYNANLITDYTNLQIWLNGQEAGAIVYWSEFQCPMPVSGGTGVSNNDTNLFKGDMITISASSAIFDSQHVNSVWAVRYYSNAKSHYFGTPQRYPYISFPLPVNGDWSFTMDIKTGNINEVDQFIEKSVDEGATWFKKKVIAATDDTTTREFTGSESEECWLRLTREDDPASIDSASFTLTTQGKEVYSYFRITAVTDGTNAQGVLLSSFSRPGVAFANWSEGAWSDYRGWPTAITFYQNRLTMGGNASDPNTYGMSVVDDYETYSRQIPQVDDDAISDRLPARQVNAIQWFVPVQALIVLTTDSEWSITPGASGVLSHDSKITKQQTYFGSDSRVEPVIMGDVVVFLQRNGAKVRSLGYSYEIDGYTGNDLSVIADHLFDGYQIMDWAYQQTPNSILWPVRSDGRLLSFTFHKEHDVWAWTKHETQGAYESIAAVPGDGQDDTYYIVRRTINGVEKRYVEISAHRDVSGKENFFGVDCGATRYSETPSNLVTGLYWLEGKRVAVLADGLKSYYTVVDGKITLSRPARLVHVGLEFEYLFKSLQVDLGSTSDRKKVINGVTISLINSYGGEVGTDEKNIFTPITYPNEKSLHTCDIPSMSLASKWDYNGQVIIKGSGVFPLHIVSIAPQVTVGGK